MITEGEILKIGGNGLIIPERQGRARLIQNLLLVNNAG